MSLESPPSSDQSSDILNRDGHRVSDEDGGRRKPCFDICNWSAEFCRSKKLFTIHRHVFPLQVPACCVLCCLPPSRWTPFISSTLLLKNTLGRRQEERYLKRWAEQRLEFTDLQSSVYQCALSRRQLTWWQYQGITPKLFYITHHSLVNGHSSWGCLINCRSRRQRNTEIKLAANIAKKFIKLNIYVKTLTKKKWTKESMPQKVSVIFRDVWRGKPEKKSFFWYKLTSNLEEEKKTPKTATCDNTVLEGNKTDATHCMNDFWMLLTLTRPLSR